MVFFSYLQSVTRMWLCNELEVGETNDIPVIIGRNAKLEVPVYMYGFIYIYIYTHTHTHTHTLQNSSQTTVIYQTTAVLSRTREEKEVAVSFWKIYVFRKLSHFYYKML